MQLGQIVDYCVEYDNMQSKADRESKKPTKRMATQADIDAYFGARKDS